MTRVKILFAFAVVIVLFSSATPAFAEFELTKTQAKFITKQVKSTFKLAGGQITCMNTPVEIVPQSNEEMIEKGIIRQPPANRGLHLRNTLLPANCESPALGAVTAAPNELQAITPQPRNLTDWFGWLYGYLNPWEFKGAGSCEITTIQELGQKLERMKIVKIGTEKLEIVPEVKGITYSAKKCAPIESGKAGEFTTDPMIAEGITLSPEGPYWHVNGTNFKEGTKQLKLQLKGTATLKSSIVGLPTTIECKNSTSEGASIEGQGKHQGQGKGRLVLTQCTIVVSGNKSMCKIAEPITTNQLKSHLVWYEGTQSHYADLFEPQQGTTFANVKIANGTEKCPVVEEVPIKGTVAAEFVPKGLEAQEDLLNFPEQPITKASPEDSEKEVHLFLGSTEAKLAASFGARLATGERWGVFES